MPGSTRQTFNCRKLPTGYSGVTPGETTWVGAIDYSKPTGSCPSGEHFYGWVNFDHPFQSVTVPGSSILKVTNGVKTAVAQLGSTVARPAVEALRVSR